MLIAWLWKLNTIRTTVRICEPWPGGRIWKEEWILALWLEAWGKWAIRGFRLSEYVKVVPMASESFHGAQYLSVQIFEISIYPSFGPPFC